MEDELRKRNIPIWRITPEYWAEELGAIEHLKKLGI
jgi:hypothetical protein